MIDPCAPFDDSPLAFVRTDASQRIVVSNSNFSRWLGVPAQQLSGNSFPELLSLPARMYFLNSLLPALKHTGRAEEVYLEFSAAGDARLPLLAGVRSTTDLPGGHDFYMLPMLRRQQIEHQLIEAREQARKLMVEQRQANQELEQVRAMLEAKQEELTRLNARLAIEASTDPLTGLANRRAFNAAAQVRLASFFQEGTPLALVLFDIDFFKRINDTYGHEAGDNVLRELALYVLSCIREHDLLARIGGEEFALLLANVGRHAAACVAGRIRQGLHGRALAGHNITISAGITLPEPGDTPGSLMLRADQALYRAKRDGRDRVTVV